jgi:hypothetical protein
MSDYVPEHLRGLSEEMRAAIVAAAAAHYAANPPPPLSQATKDALRILLRDPAQSTERAA